jgi:hypothetical protein
MRKSNSRGGAGAEVILKLEGEAEDKTEQPQDANHYDSSDPRSGINTREPSPSGGTEAEATPKVEEEMDDEVCSSPSKKFEEEVGEQILSDTSVKCEESEEQRNSDSTEYSTHMFTANEQTEETFPGSRTHIDGPSLHSQNTRSRLETLRVQLATIIGHMDNARKENENARREVENSRRQIESSRQEIEESRIQLAIFQSQLVEYSQPLGVAERACAGEE